MKERAVVFEKNPSLVGIVTEPAEAVARKRTACILLNAGLVHRVGPNRLYVRLARTLAEAGFRVMRVDLSGRGDSDVRRDSLSFIESSVREISAAMDFLEKSGSSEFVLLGICSGAVNSLQLAIADPRVAGCVAIDAPAYPTRGYYLRRYVRRIANVESWRNTLAGRNAFGRWIRGRVGVASAGRVDEEDLGNPFGQTRVPTKPEAEQILKGIVDRGARLLFVFSGSWTAYNYKNQFADAFPFIRKSRAVRVEYFPAADHTFTRLFHQGMLVQTVTSWVTDNWPSSGIEGRTVRHAVPETTPQ